MATLELGQRLITSLILKQDLATFFDAKLNDKYFVTNEEKALYKFTDTFVRTHGKLPYIKTIEAEFGELPSAVEPPSFYLVEIEERFGRKLFNNTLKESADLLKEQKLKEISNLFSDSVATFRNSGGRQNIMDFGVESVSLFKYIIGEKHKGTFGIHTGWKTLDQMSDGLAPGDIFSVIGLPACLAGDTEILVSRRSNGAGSRVYTLKQLYERFNGAGIPSVGMYGQVTVVKHWDLDIPTRIPSLKEDSLTGLNAINAVMYSGVKEVFAVTTTKGNTIKTTLDHRFLTPEGYKELRDIKVGDKVICKQDKIKIAVKKVNKYNLDIYTDLKYSNYKKHKIKGNYVSRSRLNYDAALNGCLPDQFMHLLKNRPNHGFVFSDPKMEIHHIDGDSLNDSASNLQLLTPQEHNKVHHLKNNNLKRFGCYGVSEFKVTSITSCGLEDTYDISMNDPYNNFVAHDFVVHNSGKAQPLDSKVLTPEGFINMGDVQLNNFLCSVDGRISIVKGIYPQGIKQTYLITLEDGRKAECCGEHLWQASYNLSIEVVSTLALIEVLKTVAVYLPVYHAKNDIKYVAISSIELHREVECQCISVSHASKLYITDDNIVTHNTFMGLWVAYNAYIHQRKNVIFLSMEMSKNIITQRMAGIITKASMGEINNGVLSTYKLDSILTTLTSLTNLKHKLHIVDGSLKSSVKDVEALIHQYKPDLLVIDGAYLLTHDNPKLDRYTKVADNVEKLKGVAETTKIPMMLSYQFSKEAAKKKAKGDAVGLEDIGSSVAIGQISSVVLALKQPESAETLNQRIMTILKGRNGEEGSFNINWNFENLDFSEIATHTPFSGGEDENMPNPMDEFND